MSLKSGAELRGDRRGVSEVLGAILIVGIVMILITLTSPWVYGPLLGDQAPNADFRFDQINETTVQVLYWNGNLIDANELVVTVDGAKSSNQFSGEDVLPGDRIHLEASAGQTIRVIWDSSRGGQSEVLSEYTVRESGGNTANPLGEGTQTPSSTPTPTPTPTPSPPSEEPAAFDVELIETNSPVDEGDVIIVTVEVQNVGDQADSQSIDLHVIGKSNPIDTELVDLAGGRTDVIELEWETQAGDGGPGRSSQTWGIEIYSGDDQLDDEVEVRGSGGGGIR